MLLPDVDHPILTCGGQPVAVQTEGHAVDGIAVLLQRQDFLTRDQLPEADGAVGSAGGQPLAVRTEREAVHDAGMAAQWLDALGGGQIQICTSPCTVYGPRVCVASCWPSA